VSFVLLDALRQATGAIANSALIEALKTSAVDLFRGKLQTQQISNAMDGVIRHRFKWH